MNLRLAFVMVLLSSSVALAQGGAPSPQGKARKRQRIEICGPIIQGPRKVPDAVTIIETRRPEPNSLLRLRRDFRSHMDRSTLPAP